ncbi:abortive infection system antitoxin AbiGi family protein [Aquimarina sp. D1M17]|uniref:abortive infection system antitoxin AbiGi family protein n=1 Tax=Aquimarina acroporae TaxID=2937283 RepID=UPI0020BF5FE4|nr:abortive infection system antitoxin AbiGi family protein [Aquimarina acroporae]MCK8521944.1 abortive infection system antitoxin AbiGi family protein [Aquimarina acroporae]
MTSILCNGFYSSYADESIADRKTKIMMVSFSNVPLIESRNQVSYGDYFIGLKRDWGTKNGLHPVAYTYKGSDYERGVWDLMRESALGQTLHLLKEHGQNGVNFHFEGDPLKNLSELNFEQLTDNNIQALERIFEKTHSQMYDMILYLKPYIVTDSKGQERLAYNDREWRYIPRHVEKKIIYETDASGNEFNKEFAEWTKKSKPHYKENPLKFELNDINFIIAKEQNEIHIIYKILFEKYTKEKVIEQITNGQLIILSLDKVTSDL